jgi:hypothetical protein
LILQPFLCAASNRQRTRIAGIIPHLFIDGPNLMLKTIAIILLIMWVLGLVSPLAIGGLLHMLLVVAVILFLVDVIQGRRV